MKTMVKRIIALGLVLLLCAGTAAAQTAEDVHLTVLQKLAKQLDFGSGFEGTLTLTADAVEGRESDAISTIMPIVMDVRYIQLAGGAEQPAQSRLSLLLNNGEYQQGNIDLSMQDGALYLQSSLLDDQWYLVSNEILQPLLTSIGVQGDMQTLSQLEQATGQLPGLFSFISGMATGLISAKSATMDKSLQAMMTDIDFWLEEHRQSIDTVELDNEVPAMEATYRIPPEDVKAKLKQLITELLSDEKLLTALSVMLNDQQAALYLEPDLIPYYMYAVDGLPLEGDLVINRVASWEDEMDKTQITMPLYDSVTGSSVLTYTRSQDGVDMPFHNILGLESADSYMELSFDDSLPVDKATVNRGTILMKNKQADGSPAPIYWAAFTLSTQSETTKDLNSYETQYETIQFSLSPATIPEGEDASAYAVIPETNIALDMKLATRATKTSPTTADMTLTISGSAMAQTITLSLSGATEAKWTPVSFATETATDLIHMAQEDLQSLLSRVVVKGGLLFLPYINLPQITAAPGQ